MGKKVGRGGRCDNISKKSELFLDGFESQEMLAVASRTG